MIGEISALGCALCWAISSTLTKSLVGKFEPTSLNLLRCLAASVLLWAIIPFFPGTQALSQAPWVALVYLVASAFIGIAAGDTIYIRGLKLIEVTLAFPIAQSAMPLLTLFLAVLFLGEPITRSLVLGTALILAGIYLITSPRRGSASPQTLPASEKRAKGIIFILTASVLWAISISLLKVGLEEVSPILANGIRLPVASLALVLFLLSQQSFRQPTRVHMRDVGLGACSGILSFGLGGLLFLQAIRYAGAGKATVLTSCAPLFGLPLSLVFLKEKVTMRIIAGTILSVLGIRFIL